MSSFLEAYKRGKPVAVYRDERLFGIPCGFAIFSDGLSWADDGVLALDYASHHTRHALFGPVTVTRTSISCDRHRFVVGPKDDPRFVEAWHSLTLSAAEWISVHGKQERGLRMERRANRC